MKLRFTKLPKHKGFDYQPRYYDERKERLEERKLMFKKDADKASSTRSGIEINFRRNSSNASHYRSKQLRSANLRLILILATLFLACYYFFIHMDKLTYIIDEFTN